MKKKLFIILTTIFTLSLIGCTTDPVSSSTGTTHTTDSDITDPTSTTTTTEEPSTTTDQPSTDSSSGGDEDGHYPMNPKYNSYYSSIDFNQPKDSLMDALTVKISGHTSLTYDEARTAMKRTDRDWKLSPNENESDPYMHLIYATYNGSTSTAKKFSTNNTVWDREHIWAKSHGDFGETKPRGTDLHHLRASDKSNNGLRSNYDFANVTSASPNVLDYTGTPSGTKGTVTYNGTSSIAYEPQDCDKGDIARAMLYMATRYHFSNSEGATLTLVNRFTSGKEPNFGILEHLIEWHTFDPVDEFEMNRNNLIFEHFQFNRNPFIDHPELVAKLFG